jgi:ribosome-binding protein aMBF1 (putative translation factor)
MCQHEGAATVMVDGMEVELCEACQPRPKSKKASESDDARDDTRNEDNQDF